MGKKKKKGGKGKGEKKEAVKDLDSGHQIVWAMGRRVPLIYNKGGESEEPLGVLRGNYL